MWRTLLALTMLTVAMPAAAERLYISTEEYPPYNFRDAEGQPTGVYMDQLKIILERAHIDYEATILPWARALALCRRSRPHRSA
jgi:polar amino acid transport system substrate-binding protein